MEDTGKGYWKVLNWVIFWRATCYFQALPSQREACLPAGLPPPQPLLKFAATSLSSLPVNLLLCHWKVFQKSPGDGCSPLCFPNYCLRKPETFIPVPRGDLFITKTSFSFTKPSWNHSASPHSHTNFPHCQLWIQSPFWNTSIIMPRKETNLFRVPRHPKKAQLSTEKLTVSESLPAILSATFWKGPDTHIQSKGPTHSHRSRHCL